jgi:hypothetical protein
MHGVGDAAAPVLQPLRKAVVKRAKTIAQHHLQLSHGTSSGGDPNPSE